MMNWDAIIAVTEIVATVGVIVTSVYVAVQVRQKSRLIDQNIITTRTSIIHDTSVSPILLLTTTGRISENPVYCPCCTESLILVSC